MPLSLSADFTEMPHSQGTFTLEGGEDPKLNLAVESLRRRGCIRLKASGTSMLPSLWPGDLLTIEGVSHDDVVPGDIVLVLRDQRFFVHRLVEKRRIEDGIFCITKGDAMPHKDPPTAAFDLLGRVASVGRDDRSLVQRRQVSQLNSVLRWALFRVLGFRNLALRIRAASLEAPPLRPGELVLGLMEFVEGDFRRFFLR